MALKKKLVLLGDSAVGKTSLIRRYVHDHFEDAIISTIGSKVTRKDLLIETPSGTVDLTMMIWDLIGREGYTAFHAKTFAGVDGALLVADLTRTETLHSLERYWIPLLFKVAESVPLVFACNKSDLKGELEFAPEDMAEMASRYNAGLEEALPDDRASWYPTSAKSGSNVEKAFESLGHLLLSEKLHEDPVKNLYTSLVATGIRRAADKTTPIGALDALLVDFCEGFEDQQLAMVILRQEIARAGIDVSHPTKEGILKAVEYLAEAEHEFMDRETVVRNRERRLWWAQGAKE